MDTTFYDYIKCSFFVPLSTCMGNIVKFPSMLLYLQKETAKAESVRNKLNLSAVQFQCHLSHQLTTNFKNGM